MARAAGVSSGPGLAPATAPVFARALRATPENIRDALAQMRVRLRLYVDADLLGRAELVLAEIMNNVTEHGGGMAADPAFIHLCVTSGAGGLSCAVSDDGMSVPQSCLAPRPVPAVDGVTTGDLPEGGFGWLLIQGLTQSLVYFREGKRNFIVFTVPAQSER